eukprot:439747-Heterocapsa_arctica.AAC.1
MTQVPARPQAPVDLTEEGQGEVETRSSSEVDALTSMVCGAQNCHKVEAQTTAQPQNRPY